jgi:hypothetical protein
MELIDALKAEADLVHLASMGNGRELFRVPIGRLGTREEFKSLRANDPGEDDFKVLQRSVSQRGVFYPPLVFAELTAGALKLFLVDGHQRYRAAKDRGDHVLDVCICTQWGAVEDAMRDGVSAQFARFAVGDEDILSIADTGKVSIGEMVTLTGFSEGKIRMLYNVAEHPRLAAIVREGLVSASRMSGLIKRCENHPGKLEALGNTMQARAVHARREAKKWTNRIKSDRSKKWDRKAIQKSDPVSYFSAEDWTKWSDALGESKLAAQIVDSTDGPVLDLGPRSKLAVRLGDAEEWKDTFALYNIAGLKHEDVDLDSLGEFIDELDQFKAYVTSVYETQRASASKPGLLKIINSTNPIVEEDEDLDGNELTEQSVEDVRLADDSND